MQKARKFDIRYELYDWAAGLLNAFIFVVVLFAFVMCLYSVTNVSMMDTLHDGDRVFISNLFYTPKRGDIVMFNKPGLEDLAEKSGLFSQPPLVKRIIAVGGDVLDIDYDLGRVYLNGEAIDEPYIRELMTERRGDIEYPVTVPEGYVFCMGDNRNHSTDSRDSRVYLIDERYILGRLLFRIFPLDRFGAVS